MEYTLAELHDYLTGLGFQIVSLYGAPPYEYSKIEVQWAEGIEHDDSVYEAMEGFAPPLTLDERIESLEEESKKR